MKISIKTRLGMDSPEEFEDLLNIYNRYAMEELIIHPRVRKDMYKNTPNMKAFEYAMAVSKNTVIYNGDIFSVPAYDRLLDDFPQVRGVMLGRGIIANPALLDEIYLEAALDTGDSDTGAVLKPAAGTGAVLKPAAGTGAVLKPAAGTDAALKPNRNTDIELALGVTDLTRLSEKEQAAGIS